MFSKQKGEDSFSTKQGLKRFALHAILEHIFCVYSPFSFWQNVSTENVDLGNLLALCYKYTNTEKCIYYLESL